MSRSPNALRFLRRYLWFLSDARRLELYPPFWLMGVKVVELAPDWGRVRLRLPLTWRSRNLGGSMFGGYQAALADPIAALACSKRFREHDVWTRRLCLDFRRPGTTDLELRFDFPPELHARIAAELAAEGRADADFEYGYHLADGRRCTTIHCRVALRPRGYAAHLGVGSAS